MNGEETLPYAFVIIKLLQGIIYDDDKESWEVLIQYKEDIIKYFKRIGIQVIIDLNEGYVFLDQKKKEGFPKLIESRQLSYPITLLLVLFREKLLEMDERGESSKLILEKKEIKSMMEVFLSEESNQAKSIDRIDSYINRLVEYGFLKKLGHSNTTFEIRRIIKSKITADKLIEIKQALEKHVKSN